MRTPSQGNTQSTDANSEMTQVLGLSTRQGLERSYHDCAHSVRERKTSS